MDLFLPRLPPGSAAPVILWIHGGAWRVGDKAWVPGLRNLLEAGFAVASVNYRLTPDAAYPAQIEDCRAAVRYLRQNASRLGIAPERIGAWGESAGGHLAALLGTTGDEDGLARVNAVCDWYGPTDLVTLGFLSAVLKASGGGDPVGDLLGGPISQREGVARQASPLSHISPDDAPFLIMHGNADTVVPLNQSQVFAEALKKAGVDVEFVTISGARHSDDRFLEPENIKRVVSFFQKHLNAQSVDAGGTSDTSPG
jgi:acetyl esterase/lipase